MVVYYDDLLFILVKKKIRVPNPREPYVAPAIKMSCTYLYAKSREYDCRRLCLDLENFFIRTLNQQNLPERYEVGTDKNIPDQICFDPLTENVSIPLYPSTGSLIFSLIRSYFRVSSSSPEMLKYGVVIFGAF